MAQPHPGWVQILGMDVTIEAGTSGQAGKGTTRWCRHVAEQECRPHIDVMCLLAGMQSAALGFALARKHFADPLVAVPSAVSVVFMALGGSGLAVFWRGKPTTD